MGRPPVPAHTGAGNRAAGPPRGGRRPRAGLSPVPSTGFRPCPGPRAAVRTRTTVSARSCLRARFGTGARLRRLPPALSRAACPPAFQAHVRQHICALHLLLTEARETGCAQRREQPIVPRTDDKLKCSVATHDWPLPSRGVVSRASGRRAKDPCHRRGTGLASIIPATSYSPRGLPPKYHRRWWS